MKKAIAGIAAAGLLGLSLFAGSPAFASDVCGPGTSGKIDTTGDPSTVTITAPEGHIITGYCVKAGSSNQGNGPVDVSVAPGDKVTTMMISYPGGKDISHYSFITQPLNVEDKDPVKPPQPNPIREANGIKSMIPDCVADTLTITTEYKTTEYVYDAATNTWVLGTPIFETKTDVAQIPPADRALYCPTTETPVDPVTPTTPVEPVTPVAPVTPVTPTTPVEPDHTATTPVEPVPTCADFSARGVFNIPSTSDDYYVQNDSDQDGVACEQDTTAVPEELAYTGSNDGLYALGGAALLALLGGTALLRKTA